MSQLPLNGLFSLASLVNKPPSPWTGGLGLISRAGQQVTSSTVPAFGSPQSLMSGLASLGASTDATKWMYVIDRFKAFLNNLKLGPLQVDDGETKFKGVVSCLNVAYYGHNSETANVFLIGSWAKGTCIRPPRDVDLYFVLPPDVYHRFESYAYGVNKQSALLQEVKTKLLGKYGSSSIKGDGPVVLAGFTSYNVELVPAFALTEDRTYWVCNTKDGGSYMKTKPLHEVDAIEAADGRNANNVRRLIRMLKAWQAWCSVPIKSFYLELLAIEFLDQSAWRNNDYLYYDWICRDFFQWMIGRVGSFVLAPGTYDVLWLGDAWKSRAESAYSRADKACYFERENKMIEAGDEWQKIFGTDIPRYV